jgi:hypothetical protein
MSLTLIGKAVEYAGDSIKNLANGYTERKMEQVKGYNEREKAKIDNQKEIKKRELDIEEKKVEGEVEVKKLRAKGDVDFAQLKEKNRRSAEEDNHKKEIAQIASKDNMINQGAGIVNTLVSGGLEIGKEWVKNRGARQLEEVKGKNERELAEINNKKDIKIKKLDIEALKVKEAN